MFAVFIVAHLVEFLPHRLQYGFRIVALYTGILFNKIGNPILHGIHLHDGIIIVMLISVYIHPPPVNAAFLVEKFAVELLPQPNRPLQIFFRERLVPDFFHHRAERKQTAVILRIRQGIRPSG